MGASVLETAPPHWSGELHELCQPLTRLQWRLEIGRRAGDEATLRETVEGSLEDVKELIERVRQMRSQLAGERVCGQAGGQMQGQDQDAVEVGR
jgi:C4-dicarboxylate-specific signal transduction histidine kinase